MDRVKFDPKELEPIGYFRGANPKAPPTPVFNSPISRKENFLAMVRGETPLWLPSSNEFYLFMPTCVPDNWARGMVSAFSPVSFDQFGGKDMFGVEWEYVPTVRGSMVRPGNPFVADLEHWEDYVKMPDIDSWDWEGCAKESEALRNDGRLVKVSMMTGLFERLISFVEMTNAMVALVDEDSQVAVHRLFDKLCEVYDKIFEKFEKYFHADIVWFHDDWGSQRAPFFSANTVREMILPYLKRCVESAHKHGMVFELHCCGQVEALVPCMIEAGVDCWNGQTMNDKKKMAQMYGDKIIVDSSPDSLGLDATPEQVEANVRKYLEDFKGLRTYVARRFENPAIEAEYIYKLSREMMN